MVQYSAMSGSLFVQQVQYFGKVSRTLRRLGLVMAATLAEAASAALMQ